MLSRRTLVRSGGGVNSGLKPPAVNTKLSEPPRSAMSPVTSNVADPRARQRRVERHVAGRRVDDAGEIRLQVDDRRVGLGHRDPELADDDDRDRVREREHHADGHRDERDRTAPAELEDRRRPRTGRASAGNTVATAESTRSARAMRSSRDQDVVGAAVPHERAQRRRVDRPVEPEDAADRVQREAEEDLDRRRELHRHDDDERQLAVDLLDDAERLDGQLE